MVVHYTYTLTDQSHIACKYSGHCELLACCRTIYTLCILVIRTYISWLYLEDDSGYENEEVWEDTDDYDDDDDISAITETGPAIPDYSDSNSG